MVKVHTLSDCLDLGFPSLTSLVPHKWTTKPEGFEKVSLLVYSGAVNKTFMSL